jgi:DNA topoisomerase IB
LNCDLYIVIDINTTLAEIITCLQSVSTSLDNLPDINEHSYSALSSLCKSVEGFRQSSKRLFEYVSEKTKQSLIESKNNPMKTPPRMGEIATPSDFGQWNANLYQMNAALQQCSETLPSTLYLLKKKVTLKKHF